MLTQSPSSDVTGKQPHGYRLSGYTFKSKKQVVGSQQRVTDVITILTSPCATNDQHPFLKLLPFPCFAFHQDVVPMDGSMYRAIFNTANPLTQMAILGASSSSLPNTNVLNTNIRPYGNAYCSCSRSIDFDGLSVSSDVD